MKKIFMLLSLIPSCAFAMTIDAGTQITWNSGVVKKALDSSGVPQKVQNVCRALYENPKSVSEMVSKCVKCALLVYGELWDDDQGFSIVDSDGFDKSKAACTKFGRELVVINNSSKNSIASCPDKYVWVEKTHECVPMNPCKADDIDIKTVYCINSVMTVMPGDDDKYNLVVDKYVDKVLNKKVVSVNHLEPFDSEWANSIVGVNTADGDYFALVCSGSRLGKVPLKYYIQYAIGAYGYNEITSYAGGSSYYEGEPFESARLERVEYKVKSNTECEEIADFASLLADHNFDRSYKDGVCVFVFPESIEK